MMHYPEITTRQLKEMITNDNTRLLDVRPVDAYNGWQLWGETRGGHIASAKSLSADWAEYIDWIEIVRNKQILPEHQIILYGYTPDQAIMVAKRFTGAGYNNISLYNHFLDEWAPDKQNPMEQLSRYRQLVPASWVKDVVDGKTPPEHQGGKTVICHAHYRNREAYLSGHIPGAIDLDTNALESIETWNRRTPEELQKTLLEHGITADTTVILYGKFMSPDNNDEFPGSSAGHIGAIRCAFIMLYAGVKDVKVLNGGFHAWEAAGFGIHYDDVVKTPVKHFGRDIPAHPELVVDLPEARQMLASDHADLVCVRSWPEYIGEVSGYNYIEKKGRIPGAIFVHAGSDAYHMETYRNLDFTTREFHEIAALWEEAGINPDKHLAFYCGTGWRGSEAFFNAWLMGWPKVSVFDGGWFEWSNDPENHFETGVPE